MSIDFFKPIKIMNIISSIEISGYKSIHKEKIDLKPINILIGKNGSGKSNFISFFVFLQNLSAVNLTQHVALTGGENKVLHKGKKVTDSISFKIDFKNGANGYAATLQSGISGFTFTDERLIYKGDPDINYKSFSTVKVILATNVDSRNKDIINCLKGFRKYHFHDTSNLSPFTDMSHIGA